MRSKNKNSNYLFFLNCLFCGGSFHRITLYQRQTHQISKDDPICRESKVIFKVQHIAKQLFTFLNTVIIRLFLTLDAMFVSLISSLNARRVQGAFPHADLAHVYWSTSSGTNAGVFMHFCAFFLHHIISCYSDKDDISCELQRHRAVTGFVHRDVRSFLACRFINSHPLPNKQTDSNRSALYYSFRKHSGLLGKDVQELKLGFKGCILLDSVVLE